MKKDPVVYSENETGSENPLSASNAPAIAAAVLATELKLIIT